MTSMVLPPSLPPSLVPSSPSLPPLPPSLSPPSLAPSLPPSQPPSSLPLSSLSDVSLVQDAEVGDGTTSVTVLTCELLKVRTLYVH